jgi:hypothetical protein
MTVNPPWLIRQRLRARHAARTATRAASRAVLLRLLERMPVPDLNATVRAAHARRARRLRQPVRVPREEWQRDGLLATIRRHAAENTRVVPLLRGGVVQDGIAQGRADLQFTHRTPPCGDPSCTEEHGDRWPPGMPHRGPSGPSGQARAEQPPVEVVHRFRIRRSYP